MTYEDDNNFFEIASDSDIEIASDTDNDIVFALRTQNDMIYDINNDIRSWIIKHNISHIAANDLLEILRKHKHKDLPMDVRSLMKTPRNDQLNIVHFSQEGKYVHFGLEKSIKLSVQQHYVNVPQTICINFRI